MVWAPASYVTVGELRDYLRIDDTDDDAVLGDAVSAASRAIDRACGRQFGLDEGPTQRYYTATYSASRRAWIVPIDDLMSTAPMTVVYDENGDQSFTRMLPDFRKLPINAAANRVPWTELLYPSGVTGPGAGEHGVLVTATFGWDAVPWGIRQATLLQASRFASRRDSPYGIAGSPDVGSEMRLLAKVDPDVEVSIAPYRRTWWVA